MKKGGLKIIINGFNDIFLPVVYRLLEDLPASYFCVINTAQISFPADITGDSYSYYDMRLGSYSNVNWNKVLPLDSDIMEKMVECETVVLKMMERLEPGGIDVRSYQKRKEIYLCHLRYWNHVIEAKQVNLAIFATVPHMMYDYVIYSLCKLKKIETLMFYRMPVLPEKSVLKYLINDYKKPLEDIQEKYAQLIRNFSIDTSEDIELSPSSLAYIDAHSVKGDHPEAYINPETSRRKVTLTQRIRSKTAELVGVLLGLSTKGSFELFYRFSIHRKRISINHIYSNQHAEPDLNCKFVYLALHFQPECTTSPMAGVYVDQLLIAQLISSVLPKGVLLYVKEHPRESLILNLNFYKQLLALPNVRIIKRDYNSYTLIDHSLAVATATGTAGWEGFLRMKPVLIFGYYFYQYAPCVFQIRSLRDCREAISQIIEGKVIPELKNIKFFLKATEGFTSEGYIDIRYKNVATVSEKKNIENTVNSLLERIAKIEINES